MIASRIAVAREGTRVPLNRIRRMTGDHMVMSKATSPHVLTAMEVDFEAVDQVRRQIRNQGDSTARILIVSAPRSSGYEPMGWG